MSILRQLNKYRCANQARIFRRGYMTYLWLALALFSVSAAAQSDGVSPRPLLARLVAEALGNNPEIQAARQEREAAQQRIAPAGALDDPMLEAGVLNLPASSLRFDMTAVPSGSAALCTCAIEPAASGVLSKRENRVIHKSPEPAAPART